MLLWWLLQLSILWKAAAMAAPPPNHHDNNLVIGISSMRVNMEQVGLVPNKREDNGQKEFVIDTSKKICDMAINK